MFQNILVIFQKTLAHRNEKYFVWINTQWQEKWCYHLNFNWDSLHAWLNSHCEAWRYKKKKHKKIKANWKAVQRNPKEKRCLLTLDLKPFIDHRSKERNLQAGNSMV